MLTISCENYPEDCPYLNHLMDLIYLSQNKLARMTADTEHHDVKKKFFPKHGINPSQSRIKP